MEQEEYMNEDLTDNQEVTEENQHPPISEPELSDQHPNKSETEHPLIKRKRGRPRKEKDPVLSPMETAFVDAYLDPGCGYNSRAAAIKAGHQEKGSKEYGIKLMEDVRVLRAIELGRKKLTTAIATSRQDMLRKTEAFLAIAMEKRDVVGASKILQLQINMLGYNEPVKMDLTGSINISFGSGEPIIVASKNQDRYSDATDVTDEFEETTDIEEGDQDFTLD
jgi:hypothetical protein